MKIYLAGTGGHEELVRRFEVPYILESFLSVKPWQIEYGRTCRGFLIDSGAFSFLRGKREAIDFTRHVDEYSDWLIEHEIELFVEMDVDILIGHDAVLKLTDRLEQRVGRQSIPVWHVNRGKDEFMRLCRDYPYIGCGGVVSGEMRKHKDKIVQWFVATAHKNGTQVHGFGFTDVTRLRDINWDSVDSTTWHNAARWGHPQYLGRVAGSVNRYRNDITKQSGKFARPGERCTMTPEELYSNNLATWAELARRMDIIAVRKPCPAKKNYRRVNG